MPEACFRLRYVFTISRSRKELQTRSMGWVQASYVSNSCIIAFPVTAVNVGPRGSCFFRSFFRGGGPAFGILAPSLIPSPPRLRLLPQLDRGPALMQQLRARLHSRTQHKYVIDEERGAKEASTRRTHSAQDCTKMAHFDAASTSNLPQLRRHVSVQQ